MRLHPQHPSEMRFEASIDLKIYSDLAKRVYLNCSGSLGSATRLASSLFRPEMSHLHVAHQHGDLATF